MTRPGSEGGAAPEAGPDRGGTVAADAARLVLGTLTVLPVPAPRLVDPRRAGWAMVAAPPVGLVLAVLPALVIVVLNDSAPLVVAALAIGLLALLTRGLHLDGLADTADGLGSGRPAQQALEVMRRGDVGPFGVVTLVVVLLLQAAALAELIAHGDGAAALVLSLVTSRLVLPLLCVRGVPAARAEGLGRVVAGSVGRGQAVVAVLVAAATATTAVLTLTALSLIAVAVGLAAAGVLALRAVRRLGGITGDVLGACVEVAFTVILLVLALG